MNPTKTAARIRRKAAAQLPLVSRRRRQAQRQRGRVSAEAKARFTPFQCNPNGYLEDILHVSAWAGRRVPGQRELLDDIGESVRMQLAGECQPDGRPPFQIFRVEAGHGVGKTWIGAALVNWFFDCFAPSITMTTAPTKEQVESLLWKNVKKLRPAGLPGRVLPGSPRMEKGPDHFAFGRTTSDSGGKGTERFQGQHDNFLLFMLDEAEGIPDFVFDAVDAMMTGGQVVLWLLFANPRTRTSRFHKLGKKSTVKNYRLSVLDHPNVVDGADTVPGATSRVWVDGKIEEFCESVPSHDPDNFTFTVPWRPGLIYRPNSEFLFRVMGIAPPHIADKTLISVGRYEAACARALPEDEANALGAGVVISAQMGVDVAGFGKDFGTLYTRLGMRAWRVAQFWKQDYDEYARRVTDEAERLKAAGATHLSIRIDAGGGFGQGVLSHLKSDLRLKVAFPEGRLTFHTVHFGVPPQGKAAQAAYADLVTQMYAEAAETLRGLRIKHAPNELEADLCERQYDWKNDSGVSVRKLEEKAAFRKRHKDRSPDDGDGFVLAVAPEYIFAKPKMQFH